MYRIFVYFLINFDWYWMPEFALSCLENELQRLNFIILNFIWYHSKSFFKHLLKDHQNLVYSDRFFKTNCSLKLLGELQLTKLNLMSKWNSFIIEYHLDSKSSFVSYNPARRTGQNKSQTVTKIFPFQIFEQKTLYFRTSMIFIYKFTDLFLF